MSKNWLYRRTRDGLAVTDAITAWQALEQSEAWAIWYAPGRAGMGRLAGGDAEWLTSSGQPHTPSDAFELRIFNEAAELRWTGPAGGLGRAAVLSHDEDLISRLSDSSPLRPLEYTDTLPQRYLLWGQGTDAPPAADGWSALAEARLGRMEVPVAGLGLGRRAEILACEYLVEDEQHGNVTVGEERLLKIAEACDGNG